MKKDIQNRKDLELMVKLFYEKVKVDKTIGHYFTEVMHVNWEKHLPIMINFWENLLFFDNDYEGNPMSIHKTIDKKSKMQPKDFKKWTQIFNSTIDELFEGTNANTIKYKAEKIASIMSDSLFKKS